MEQKKEDAAKCPKEGKKQRGTRRTQVNDNHWNKMMREVRAAQTQKLVIGEYLALTCGYFWSLSYTTVICYHTKQSAVGGDNADGSGSAPPPPPVAAMPPGLSGPPAYAPAWAWSTDCDRIIPAPALPRLAGVPFLL